MGTAKSQEVAKKILSLQQVELATHTYSHPFDWKFFEDPQQKQKEIQYLYLYPYGSWQSSYLSWLRSAYYLQAGEVSIKETNLGIGYVIPRAYANHPFDLVNEIARVLEEGMQVPDGEKLKWVAALKNFHRYGEALELFLSYPTTAWTSKEYLLWLELLGELKDKETLKQALFSVFCYLNSPKDLEIAIEYAELLQLQPLQKEILIRLCEMEGALPLYWKKLGILAFAMGDLTSACEDFNHYFTFECFDKEYYYIQYLYGEILLARNDPLKAQAYYESALSLIDQAFPLTPAMRSVRATLHARLREKWLGEQELASLYAENPDPQMRAAWGNAWIEMGKLEEARLILYNMEDVTYVRETEVYLLWKNPVKATVAMQRGDEILLELSEPIEQSNLQETLKQQLPEGFKAIESGHHKLLFSTDSNADFFVTTGEDLNSSSYFLRISARLYPPPFPVSLPLLLARANLALIDRNYTYASCLIGQLLEKYPKNADVLSLAAILMESVGKWQAGLNWLEVGHRAYPQNEGFWTSYRDLYFPVSSYLAFERVWKWSPQ